MDKSNYGLTTDAKYARYSEVSTVTPNYAYLKYSGAQLPIRDYYAYSREYSQNIVFKDGYYYYGTSSAYDDFAEVMNSSGPRRVLSGRHVIHESNQDLVARATNRLLSKCRDTSVDLGVTLGEYAETVRMFKSAAVNTVRAVMQLKKGNFTGAMRTINGKKFSRRSPRPASPDVMSKTLSAFTGKKNPELKDVTDISAQTYLFMQFGVMPLVKAVYESVELLQDGYQERPNPITVRTRLQSNSQAIVQEQIWGGSYPGNIKVVKIDRTVSARMRYWVSNPTLKTLDEVGALNPVYIAWAVMPLSFVVDWFLPIGEFLGSITPPQGVQFIDGFTYLKYGGSLSSSTVNATSNFWWACKGQVKKRSVLSSMPAHVTLKKDISLSRGQIVSSVALLWQKRNTFAESHPVIERRRVFAEGQRHKLTQDDWINLNR